MGVMNARDPNFEAWLAEARTADLLSTAAQFGTRLRRQGAEWVGPCPSCGGIDRFSINPAKRVWNCRGALGGNDAISFVMHAAGICFLDAVETLSGEPRPGRQCQQQRNPRSIEHPGRHRPLSDESTISIDVEAETSTDRIARARALWARRQPLDERYLRRARGLSGPFPPTLGFLPARGDYAPTMIAAYGLATEPEPGQLAIAPDAIMAVHLTRLKSDLAGKVPGDDAKISIGRPKRAPIVLAPPNDRHHRRN
jgi:hypothetical protein